MNLSVKTKFDLKLTLKAEIILKRNFDTGKYDL